MLVLGRKVGQTFRIGDDITVTVVSVREGQVRLGITAPADVLVLRSELYRDHSDRDSRGRTVATIGRRSEAVVWGHLAPTHRPSECVGRRRERKGGGIVNPEWTEKTRLPIKRQAQVRIGPGLVTVEETVLGCCVTAYVEANTGRSFETAKEQAFAMLLLKLEEMFEEMRHMIAEEQESPEPAEKADQ